MDTRRRDNVQCKNTQEVALLCHIAMGEDEVLKSFFKQIVLCAFSHVDRKHVARCPMNSGTQRINLPTHTLPHTCTPPPIPFTSAYERDP